MSDAAAEKSALVPFEFDNVQVRVVQIDGVPYFVASDVCGVLGISNHRDAVVKLDADEKRGVGLTDAIGREQETTVVNESGLYTLILRCRDAVTDGTVAHRFRKWVTGTVLPQIRATGSFRPLAETLDLTDSNVLRRLLLQECTKSIEYQNRAKIAEATIEVTQPKADCYDLIANAEGLFNITQAAKLLGQSPTKFMMFLRAGYLYQRGSAPIPRQEYIDRGILSLKVHMVNDKARPQSLVTPKGLAYFAKKLGVELQRELFPTAVTA